MGDRARPQASGRGGCGVMSLQDLLNARTEAYVKFSSAAWDAVDICKQYGERSPEYEAQRSKVDALRIEFAKAADAYRAAADDE